MLEKILFQLQLEILVCLEVALPVLFIRHPFRERIRQVALDPMVAGVARRQLEERLARPQPPLVGLVVDDEYHPLRAGEILLPRQRDVSLVALSQPVDAAHEPAPILYR